MMKIRYALLLSVSCLGLGSLAHAGLTPDITPVGKNTFIFTQRGASAGESLSRVSRSSYTHLTSQSKLLSASVFARRTSSDEAIHNNINGSPRRINSPRDDDSGTAFGREDYSFDLDVRVKPEHDTDDLFISTVAQSARSAFHAPISQPLTDGIDLPQVASVCFITDAGNCRGDEYTGANTPDNSSGGTPGGSGSSGGDNGNGDDPEWELDNKERCNKEGYVITSCNSVENPVNFCPYDNTYFEKCECKPGLVTCTKPYYGVGDACNGQYASCELDNQRACKEDGYTNTCPAGQKLRKDQRCQYDNSFGICCTETCPTNSATTCSGENNGDDGCGYTCKKCCTTSCPAGYEYTESQLTGANGNGWVKNGSDYCDHCTKGKLYKRKAATCSVTQTCSCGGTSPCKSGNNTYYASCNCCSSCSGSTSHAGMKYYNSCYNSCTRQTLYTERSCNNSCAGQSRPTSCAGTIKTSSDECGNTCYRCEICKSYKAIAKNCKIESKCYRITNTGRYEKNCTCTVSSELPSCGGYGKVMSKISKNTKEECEAASTDTLRCSSYEGKEVNTCTTCYNA